MKIFVLAPWWRKKLAEVIIERSYCEHRSNVYFDLDFSMFNPKGSFLLGQGLFETIIKRSNSIMRIASIWPHVSLATLVSAFSYAKGRPISVHMIEEKPGITLIKDGDSIFSHHKIKVAVIGHIVATGEALLKDIKIIEEEDFEVGLAIAVIDRQEGGAEELANSGYEFKSLFTKEELIRTKRTNDMLFAK